MGIVKLKHHRPGSCYDAQRSSVAFTLGELVQEERLLLEKDPIDDYDFFELAEVGCECVMVGDQICNVPYELYDLPDLKEILSLETWNSCLTEEERFSLAAYLPDIDQQTFWLTVKELLSGENVFFGSPLENLLHRLKGGFYSIQVAQFRKGLQFLQRREYYHSLRSYHESMTQKFVDMKRAWSNCHPSISIEERVHIWNNKKDPKSVVLVDLNVIPADEENVSKGDSDVAPIPLLKKKKYMNEGVNTHDPTTILDGVIVSTKTKAKGFLKIKPIEVNSTQNHIVQPLPRDYWEPCRRPPKGILKIKPKTDPFCQQERSRAIPILTEKPLADLAGVQTSRLAPSEFASKWHEENFENLPFSRQTIRDGKAYRCLEIPELIKGQESLNMVTGPITSSQTSQKKIKMINDMRLQNSAGIQDEILHFKSNPKLRMYSHDSGGIGECCNGENLWLNSYERSRAHCGTSAHPSAPENHRGKKQMSPVHSTVSETISRISTVGTDKHQNFLKSSDHMGHDLSDARLKTPVHMAVSRVQREGLMFPITYKRKKTCKKLTQLDSLKHPSMSSNLELLHGGINCRFVEKAKAIKIKVKGWNDYSAHYN